MRVTIGTGECNAFFEQCLRETKWGERNEFKLLGGHPLFHQTAVWNGFDAVLTHRPDFETAPSDYFVRLEIEVCGIKPRKLLPVPNVYELTTEQKKQRAEDLKKQADDKFKAQAFQEAADLYTRAYKVVFFEDGAFFNDLKLKIGSNLAFANLKLKRYEDCINMNDQFIRFGYEVSDKNYFRNAQAAELWGRFEEAIKFYERAFDASKDEEYRKSVEANIQTVKKKVADKNSQMRKNMQKIWG